MVVNITLICVANPNDWVTVCNVDKQHSTFSKSIGYNGQVSRCPRMEALIANVATTLQYLH